MAPRSAPASTANETLITLYSQPGDFVGGGETFRYYTPENSTFEFYNDDHWLSIKGIGGSSDETSRFIFRPPQGETLAVGDYPRARGSRDETHAGIDIGVGGRGCNEATGRFKVNEYETTSSGELESAWIVFEFHCEGSLLASVGEVRINIPGDGGAVTIGPRELRWPDSDVNQPAESMPVMVRNPGPSPVEMGAASLDGDGSFIIDNDGCDGISLGTGDMCQIWVDFLPYSAGEKDASLTIPEISGPTHVAALSGFVRPTKSRAVLYSDEGDAQGEGGQYTFDPATAIFGAGANSFSIHGGFAAPGEDDWSFWFSPPDHGIPLQEGVTYDDWSTNEQDSATVNVQGPHSNGCNHRFGSFTVHELSFDEYRDLEAFRVSFKQHCSSSMDEPELVTKDTPALHGLIEWRVDELMPLGEKTLTIMPPSGGSITSTDGEIACPGDCTATYDFAAPVRLEAHSDAGFELTSWSGGCPGIWACRIRMMTDKTIGATFGALPTKADLSVTNKKDVLVAKGSVSPDHPGHEVRTTLKVKKNGSFVPVARKTSVLTDNSTSRVTFRRRSAKTCRVSFRFAADEDHSGDTASRTFGC